MTAATPQAQLFDRLIAQGRDSEPWAYLVLSACDGEQGLARKRDSLANGVPLDMAVLGVLKPWADRWDIGMPVATPRRN